MSKIIFLCVAFTALMIQSALAQCIQNIPNNLYTNNIVTPNNGFSISGINLAPNGQAVLTNNGFPTQLSYSAVAPNALNIVATNGGNVLTTANTVSVGNGGNYGGYGTGEVSVLGELPVTGTTLVTGCLPVVGSVQFSGNVPAGGLVSVVGNQPCSCSCY